MRTHLPAPLRRARIGLVAGALALAASATGCAPPEPPPAQWEPVPVPEEVPVDRVVFLVGDAGAAYPGQSPVLTRLAREVETWSARLARDSAVAVAYLGDIVYPYGIRTGSPEFPRDSLHLLAQVEVLAGPATRRHRSVGLFIAGNHDWGQMPGEEGLERLRDLERLLDGMVAQHGVTADLVPAAGEPGPHVLDLGDDVRLLSLDTHWWLQSRDDVLEDAVVREVGRALQSAGERHVMLLSHHPFASGGAHGGPMPIWEGLGILWLLRQSGTLIQDMNSEPYTRLRLGLGALFEEIARPLVWAGGHDHSLQVIEGRGAGSPEWNLVSGSGSKLTDVADADGMRYGADRPGFMRVTVLEDGGVLLHVYAAGDGALLCGEEGDERTVERCMEEGVPAFEVVYATRLR